MDGSGTSLTDVVKGARGLLLRNPDISAVHIVDVREVDAFDRFWAESLVEEEELKLDHPRVGSWTIARKPPAPVEPPPAVPLRVRASELVRAIGAWSAGFDGLTEGAR